MIEILFVTEFSLQSHFSAYMNPWHIVAIESHDIRVPTKILMTHSTYQEFDDSEYLLSPMTYSTYWVPWPIEYLQIPMT